MSAPEHDETRLPKWAQQELQRLRANVNWWKTKATAGEDRPTDTFILHYDTDELVQYLPDGATVRFRVSGSDDDGPLRGTIEASVSDGALRLIGGSQLAVFPRASNLVYVQLIDLD